VVPLGQAQLPWSQAMPAGQGASQAPQCAGSLSKSMQTAPPQVSQSAPVSSVMAGPEAVVGSDDDEAWPLEPPGVPEDGSVVVAVGSMVGSEVGQPISASDKARGREVFRSMGQALYIGVSSAKP
jgi:hypothetical protein